MSRDQRQFWKHDVKLARNYSRNASVGDDDAQKWADDFAEFQTTDAAGRRNSEMLRNVGRPAYQHTWSPMTFQPPISINDMDHNHMYLNIAHPLHANTQFKRHYNQIGAGSSKTVIYRRSSPPKYRSLVHDPIFGSPAVGSAPQRRLSLAQFIPTPPKGAIGVAASTNRRCSSVSTAASGHKFVVTPAAEDSLNRK